MVKTLYRLNQKTNTMTFNNNLKTDDHKIIGKKIRNKIGFVNAYAPRKKQMRI